MRKECIMNGGGSCDFVMVWLSKEWWLYRYTMVCRCLLISYISLTTTSEICIDFKIKYSSNNDNNRGKLYIGVINYSSKNCTKYAIWNKSSLSSSYDSVSHILYSNFKVISSLICFEYVFNCTNVQINFQIDICCIR